MWSMHWTYTPGFGSDSFWRSIIRWSGWKKNYMRRIQLPRWRRFRKHQESHLAGSIEGYREHVHSSYGIFSKKIDRRARIAYDMQQVIRYTSAWYFHPDGGPSVDFGTPMQAEETVRMPMANCFAWRSWNWVEIHLTCLSQLEVLKEAIAVLGCLYGCKICDLFAHYTKDADTLTVARHIEQYYSGLKDKDELPKISDSLLAEAIISVRPFSDFWEGPFMLFWPKSVIRKNTAWKHVSYWRCNGFWRGDCGRN